MWIPVSGVATIVNKNSITVKTEKEKKRKLYSEQEKCSLCWQKVSKDRVIMRKYYAK